MNSNDFRSRGVPGYIPMSLESATGALANNALTVIPAGDEPIEEDRSFSLDKFQVVRREFFSHMSEPSITFSDYKIGINTACIRRLPDIDYIQFLVNRQTQKLAISTTFSFWSIARRKSLPSVRALNQICTHFSGAPAAAASESRVR